jgi:uncharacterized protein (TIGR02246 family)
MFDESAEKSAIEAQLVARTAAWNQGDAYGFTANFGEDGSFTNIAGTVIRGRRAFEQRIAQLFATIFKGSELKTAIRRLRFLRSDVAVADVDSDISCFQGLPPGVSAHEGVLRTRQLWVLVKEDGEWAMSAFHNVDVKPASASS